MAHELKHILDDPFERELFKHEENIAQRHRWVEGVCDYFAGCLLVPVELTRFVGHQILELIALEEGGPNGSSIEVPRGVPA